MVWGHSLADYPNAASRTKFWTLKNIKFPKFDYEQEMKMGSMVWEMKDNGWGKDSTIG